MAVEKIMRRPAVEDAVGLSRSSIYLMMSEGRFPKPIRIGRRAVGWPEGAIQRWLDERAERSAA